MILNFMLNCVSFTVYNNLKSSYKNVYAAITVQNKKCFFSHDNLFNIFVVPLAAWRPKHVLCMRNG